MEFMQGKEKREGRRRRREKDSERWVGGSDTMSYFHSPLANASFYQRRGEKERRRRGKKRREGERGTRGGKGEGTATESKEKDRFCLLRCLPW